MTLAEAAKELAGVEPEELQVKKIPYAGKEAPDGTPVAEDGLSIPEFCRIPKKERGFNDKKALDMAKNLPPTFSPVPMLRVVEAIVEERQNKTAARIGTLKAKKAGLVPTDKPLEGRAAVAAINEAAEKVAKADQEARQSRKAIKRAAKRPGKAVEKSKAEAATQAAAKEKNAPVASPKAGNGKSTKTELVRGLLTSKSGCTTADILEVTGWPSVSVPAMAKACGLKLRKEKTKGEVTRYFGS